VGSWPWLPRLPATGELGGDGEPVAVLTLGHLRFSQTLRFLRASTAAEGLAVRDPALLAGTALARPPRLVATFSVWRSTSAMRAFAQGESGPGHLAAIRAHAVNPFHHESAFVRFRPYAAAGEWDGRNPLATTESTLTGPALVSLG
jgi:hypothetical protein